MVTDRAFRALARAQPNIVLALLRILAPSALPEGASIGPDDVDDPHLEAFLRLLEADWLGRLGPLEVRHVECQGYRDTTFPERLLRYHLAAALRYWGQRVRTIALWLIEPPPKQEVDSVGTGDVRVSVTSVVLPRAPAAALLDDPLTACFAPGGRAGSLSADELCDRTAVVLRDGNATWEQWRMAAVVARLQGRYKEMVNATERARVEPVIIEDLVKIGEDIGYEKGLEHGREQGRTALLRTLLDILETRSIPLTAGDRARLDREESIERLQRWTRRALTARSAADVLSDG